MPVLGKAKQDKMPRVALHPFCTPQAGSQSHGDAGLAIFPPLPGSRDSLPPLAGLRESLELTLILGYGGDREQHCHLQTRARLQHVDPGPHSLAQGIPPLGLFGRTLRVS